MAAQMIADNMDYSEDDIYLERYQKELEQIQQYQILQELTF